MTLFYDRKELTLFFVSLPSRFFLHKIMESFDDIRPYNETEAFAVYRRLMDDSHFQEAIARLLPNYSVDQFRADFENYHSVYEVQVNFIDRFIRVFMDQSTKGVEYEGMEHIDPSQAYLYVANHRDITFDAAIFQHYCFIEKRNTTKIAYGDNLISTPLIGEIARLNKLFIVKRSGTIREKLADSKHLSAYIQQSLFEEKESVWIAQRDGRTKDGHDYTKQGLIKMVCMSKEQDAIKTLYRMNVTPLTISYEYEPCDALKAREMALSEGGRPYKKYPGEDFDSIKHGVFDPKGHVSLVIGTPLTDHFAEIPETMNSNEKLSYICKMIDKQMYAHYKLYATNYIAYDVMHESNRFQEFYSMEEKEQFVDYLNRKAVVRDVSKEKMMHYLLKIYGTPVENRYGKTF